MNSYTGQPSQAEGEKVEATKAGSEEEDDQQQER